MNPTIFPSQMLIQAAGSILAPICPEECSQTTEECRIKTFLPERNFLKRGEFREMFSCVVLTRSERSSTDRLQTRTSFKDGTVLPFFRLYVNNRS
ncbi:hypothetical protein CDAR_165391 [Caerostris darwini]|uniref:Uncharacterized protein n=1 Tax=Caerostris darwini TaxID=1538125 RepID=A0AAV4NWU7_9ARAC|nr:hypothetical protein CDAR_165391 [Caerostris darwini]